VDCAIVARLRLAFGFESRQDKRWDVKPGKVMNTTDMTFAATTSYVNTDGAPY
jgi:hypothetical protein